MKTTSDDLNARNCDAREPVEDRARRKILLATTVAVGGAGLAATSAAFIASMNPSEQAKAAGAPVVANISQIKPGA